MNVGNYCSFSTACSQTLVSLLCFQGNVYMTEIYGLYNTAAYFCCLQSPLCEDTVVLQVVLKQECGLSTEGTFCYQLKKDRQDWTFLGTFEQQNLCAANVQVARFSYFCFLRDSFASCEAYWNKPFLVLLDRKEAGTLAQGTHDAGGYKCLLATKR